MVNAVASCEFCGRSDVLKSVQGKWACAFCKPLLMETNPIYRLVEKSGLLIGKALMWGHHKLLSSHIIAKATQDIISSTLFNVTVFAEITRRTVRLYVIEGEHLSRKGGEQRRLTWYTHPRDARVIGEYTGRLTGRLVYVDLEVDCTSEYSHRFYQRGHEAYILFGSLMKISKSKWKYFDESKWVEESAAAVEEV